MKRKLIFSLIVLAIFLPLIAFSQLDNIHWIPPLHSRDNGEVNDHYIYLSTPSTTPFVVTITNGAGTVLATPSIDNSNPFVYSVGTGQTSGSPAFHRIDSLNKVLRHSGLILTAQEKFYANLRVREGSQADCLTAKGKAALGKTFRVGGFPQVQDGSSRNFVASFMATEANTTIVISNYNTGIVFAGTPPFSSPSITVVLNSGECYILSGYTSTPANLSGFIGALVQSDKPIVMNNGNLLGTIANNGSQDIGIDQSVPVEKTGKNYILIEGGGNSNMESPIVIAHYDNTGIFINGSSVPVATINAGQFYVVPNNYYQGSSHRNMHIHTSEPAYMYQALAGSTSYATGALNFIPPYNCFLQDSIDLIPSVNMIGSTNYTGGVFVFTQQGANLTINGVTQTGAEPVLSAPWETYKIMGLTGNIKIKSTGPVAAGIFGASGDAGYAGYFAGFSSIPLPTTFNYTDTCFSELVQFNANYDDEIDSLLWTFGDPASGTNDTSTLANPVHVFSAAGSYTVSLVVYRCENDTVKNTVNVFSAPTADFLLSDACFGDTVHFTNTSVVPPSTTLIWNFGDGTAYNGNVLHPAHYYQPGYYTVTLKAITTQGCSDSAAALIKVYDRPDVTFNFNNHCLYDTVHFANTTTNPTMGIVANWVWDFGDGTLPNSNNWSVSHLYDFPGTYQVVLIANSSNSCSDTLTDSVIIYPKPNPDFSHTDICLNQTMNFSDESNISTGSISFWSWNFGDSSMLSIIQNPVHAYANAGTYTVSLITTSNTGCKDTISKNTVVHPLPVAGYSAANVCEGSFASFTDLSVIPNPDNIQTWSWDLGDGTILSNQNTSHLYSQLGSYSVKLTINSNFGCVDSISKLFIVNPQPAAGFSVSDTAGCEPLCVIFQNTSFVVDGTIVSWFWNFGDNTSANGQQDITHCYLNFNGLVPLSFSPSLTVISDSGCISLLTKNNYITVFPTPDAAFIVSPQITTLVEPTLLVTNTSGEADLWIWDFGDQQTALIANPESHTYADTGTYLITLIASTQYTCADTAYQTVIIEPDFIFYIPNAFTPNEDGINDTFTGKGVFINEFEMYIFDRWGNLIYKTDDLNKPWDGKANNGTEIAQKDVYVYLMKVSDFKMNTHKYRGTVTLVR